MKYTVEEYREALQRHDWFYDCSEDPSVFRRGNEERQELYNMRYKLDKDYKIWNELAPRIYHISDEVSHGVS
jgi:hypothetical protein